MMGLLGNPRFQQPYQQATDFTPTRTNAMSPQSMGLLGMGQMPNLVGPTSAWSAQNPSQVPQASMLPMPGMDAQMNPPVQPPAAPEPTASVGGTWYTTPYATQAWSPHEGDAFNSWYTNWLQGYDTIQGGG